MYLVDTNVISEARKGARADAGVRAFWAAVPPDEIYLSVVTVGELRRGVEVLRHRGDLPQAARLEAWLDSVVDGYSDRILDFDLDCAQVWGKMMAPNNQHPVDRQIAAIALLHGLTVVTRNVADFKDTGVQLHNPFKVCAGAAP